MDFKRVDTRSAADAGVTLHIKHPVFGHRLYVGEGSDDDGRLIDKDKQHEPVEVVVRGYHSPKIQSFYNDRKRRGMEQGADDDAEALGEELADLLVVSWKNVIVGGESLPCTRENKRMWLELDSDLFRQVNEKARDKAAFFRAA